MGERSSKKSIWGPALWLFLHTAADFCDDSVSFCSLIMSLVGTLPCPDCRKHLKEYTTQFPPSATIVDGVSAANYVRDLHDHVNILTGKKLHKPPLLSAPPVVPTRRYVQSPLGMRAATVGLPTPPSSIASRLLQQQRPRAPRTVMPAPRLRRH